MFEDLLRAWDGEEVAIHHDAATDAWMFVCVHSTVLGPAMGGTRMKVYGSPHEALADGLRLSSAMTLKHAAADMPYGGGKAVLAVPSIPARSSDERRELLLRYAGLVDSLGGTYMTAADMNTGSADMDVIGERTSFVLGRSPEHGGSGDPGADTAVGVFHGIRATARRSLGSQDLWGRSVLVQGVGAVGQRLAELLTEAGAEPMVADVDPQRARALGERLGARVIGAEQVIGAECDIFAPCATGGVLSEETIPRLRCVAVAGSANNQLDSSRDAERLHDTGIVYAPDYVVNAGGVIHLAGYETLGWDEVKMAARLEGIGETLTEIFATADREGVTTDAAAERIAMARIDAARAAG
jgi:leucine dehydrogenase